MRSKRSVMLGCALAVALFVSSILVGCTAGAEGPPKTYTDPDYGFSFEYPSDWQALSSTYAEVVGGTAPVAVAGIGDPDGALYGDDALDMVMVRAYRLNEVIDDSLLPAALTELRALVTYMESQDSSMMIEQPLVQTTVNGLPGFQLTWTFDWDSDTLMKTTSYFLFFGDIEYQLVVQATQEHWTRNQEVFAAFLSTFRPGSSSD